MRHLSRISLLFAISAAAAAAHTQSPYSWRYYRPSNTGIQGDLNEALVVSANGDPWIAGYDPSFEEGGISLFAQASNRWINYSNVDYPVIGHPALTGISRISDIDIDSSGRLWMATGRGGLLLEPKKGASGIRRFGDDNSPIPGGWNKGVEVASDGTVWFSSYSTEWGGGGIARYTPSTNQWLVFESYGGGSLSIQPIPGGGYYVWTMLGNIAARYSSLTNSWTDFPQQDGNPAMIVGKNSTDSAGNTWMYRWTNASLNEMKFDLRRPDGSWANLNGIPFDVQANGPAAIRAISPSKAYFVDGGGTAYKFNGSTWQNLGVWTPTTSTADIDVDAAGNVWVCGQGGAAKRSVSTGSWQRYRITNTSQYDFFVNDLSLGNDGSVAATANAGSGYGGMVKFDGSRWKGYNNAQYGLGVEWPFPTDNSSKVYIRPSNGAVIVNPMFNFLHSFDGSDWTDLNAPNDTVQDVVEDSLGRLWITYFGGLMMKSSTGWTMVLEGIGGKLRRDPSRPGTIWVMNDSTLVRTDGTNHFVRTTSDFPELDGMSGELKGFAVAPNGTVWIGAYTVNLPEWSSVIKLNPATGAHTIYKNVDGWPFPGEYAMPLAATSDGKVWMQYDSDFLVARRGLLAFDGSNVTDFPAPPQGEPQWGGLPHAAIMDLEVRQLSRGYQLWMSCASRGIAVLTVQTPPVR